MLGEGAARRSWPCCCQLQTCSRGLQVASARCLQEDRGGRIPGATGPVLCLCPCIPASSVGISFLLAWCLPSFFLAILSSFPQLFLPLSVFPSFLPTLSSIHISPSFLCEGPVDTQLRQASLSPALFSWSAWFSGKMHQEGLKCHPGE